MESYLVGNLRIWVVKHLSATLKKMTGQLELEQELRQLKAWVRLGFACCLAYALLRKAYTSNPSYQRPAASRQRDANPGLHNDGLNGQAGQGGQGTQPRTIQQSSQRWPQWSIWSRWAGTQPRTIQHGPRYTVFTPDEKRRQDIAQMAQKEKAEYDQYRAAKANKTYSHVGAVGGGTLSEQEVRRKQASDLKHQQAMKRMKQEELRANRKKAEEEEIEKKKAEARRKAEMNAAREGKAPTAEELRRNREAFLRKLQNQ